MCSVDALWAKHICNGTPRFMPAQHRMPYLKVAASAAATAPQAWGASVHQHVSDELSSEAGSRLRLHPHEGEGSCRMPTVDHLAHR